ncbi:MAG: c-type cytochrome [Thiobacillaceae bacterium]|nr:c-type cytochrome [Thiobacillaceae bacterium]MCX7673654.1 c-type cytochrome [Thiobacillaceae bacterium]MDW8323910.1 c-type cytochrome [Burkholderiales bacterium]
MKTVSIVLLGLACLGAGPTQASYALADKNGCTSCHDLDERKLGPPFRQVNRRYAMEPEALVYLKGKVRSGSREVWGRAPMPPYGEDRVSEADLEAILRWVLRLHLAPE